MHAAYCDELGITAADMDAPNPATMLYCGFLEDVASAPQVRGGADTSHRHRGGLVRSMYRGRSGAVFGGRLGGTRVNVA